MTNEETCYLSSKLRKGTGSGFLEHDTQQTSRLIQKHNCTHIIISCRISSNIADWNGMESCGHGLVAHFKVLVLNILGSI